MEPKLDSPKRADKKLNKGESYGRRKEKCC